MSIVVKITNVLGIEDYDIISSDESYMLKTKHNYNDIVNTIFNTVYLRRDIFKQKDLSISFKFTHVDSKQTIYFIEVIKEEETRIIITPIVSEVVTEVGVIHV